MVKDSRIERRLKERSDSEGWCDSMEVVVVRKIDWRKHVIEVS